MTCSRRSGAAPQPMSRARFKLTAIRLAPLAVMLTASAGLAQQPAAQACATGVAADVQISAAIDGRSVVLADGRQIKLVALETPDGEAGRAAKEALARLSVGKPVGLIAAGDHPDRYGQYLAQAVILPDSTTLEERLLADGQAQVSTAIADRDCRNALLAAEGRARDRRLGLWQDENFQIKQADDTDRLLAQQGRFTIVEGRLMSVREAGATFYLNFGRRWSRDFAVTISKRNERIFTAAGLEPKRLEGRRVRIRGYIETRGGPWIEAVTPAQIELAEGH